MLRLAPPLVENYSSIPTIGMQFFFGEEEAYNFYNNNAKDLVLVFKNTMLSIDNSKT